jgi:glycerol-1-phosphate dehydrogenase [NAD(P)+]
VERTYFREFLSHFDAEGTCHCSCGRDHHVGTRTVLMDRGALEASARSLVQEHGTGVRLWVLSDENTEAAAAARWKAALPGGRVTSRVLAGRPKPPATLEVAQQLSAEARAAAPDLLIGVGSGVISDLVKRVSLEIDRPNWSVGTAASVDAYPSATVALSVKGYKSAIPGRVSEVIVCDLDVIAGAPREMFLAGFGDLLAKFCAHLDWNLSRLMTGEEYCPLIAGLALESARGAISAARTMRDDPSRAVRTLTDAALSSGFAMQASEGSRPAASAEHTLSHFWETAHAVGNERLDLHGVLVGAATKIILAGYRPLYERLETAEPDVRGRLDLFDAERPWQETMEEGMLPFSGKVRDEMERRPFDRGTLARRLETFRTRRGEVLALGRSMLEELGAAVEALEGLRYPFSPAELGIARANVQLPVRNVRLLRSRYSGFDLAYELGLQGIIPAAVDEYLAAQG